MYSKGHAGARTAGMGWGGGVTWPRDDHIAGRLSLVVVVARTDRALDGEAATPELVAEAAATDPQQFRRPDLIPPGPLKDARQQLPLHDRQAVGVQLPGAGIQSVGDESVPVQRRG